jgi:hypothetical protein
MALSPAPPTAHHGSERWTWDDEAVTGLVVSADTLSAGSDATLELLLHEAAHLLCFVRGVQDTSSRAGVYHNAAYRDAAAEVGLYWPPDQERHPRKGYVSPELTDATRAQYADVAMELERAIPLVLPHLVLPETPSTRTSDRRTRACKCARPRTIRVSPTVAEKGPIICGICEQPFTET